MSKKSYSQLNQDVNVINFYNGKKNGFFIDIGAHNGISLSNTYLLEKEYEWTGICIEPNPHVFEKLCVNRPNTLNIDIPLSNKDNETVVFTSINDKDEMLSGIKKYINHHKSTINSNKHKKEILLKTATLTTLLNRYTNIPSLIDYISLDTEGSEYEILKGFDFTKYKVGIFDIEHNYVEPTRSNIKKLLESNGYVRHMENKWDDSYVHKSLIEKK